MQRIAPEFATKEKQGTNEEQKAKEEEGSKEQGKRLLPGATLCFLGFSLTEMLGHKVEDEEDKEEEEGESELILMIKRGVLAFHLREYNKSESLLHIALHTAQELEDDTAVTYIFDVLANLAYQRGQYDKAEALFRSVLQRYVSDGGDMYSNKFVAVSLKIAHCFDFRGDIDNAVMGFQYCIAAQAEKLQEAKDISMDKFMRNRPIPYFDKAMKSSSTSSTANIGNTSSASTTTTNNHTSTSLTDNGNSNSASISDETLEDIYSPKPDEDTLVLWAMSIEQYAQLVLRLRQYSVAMEYFKQALQVSLRVHGPQHPQTAVLRNDIGTVYSRQGCYAEATDEIQQAVEIAKARLIIYEASLPQPLSIGVIIARSVDLIKNFWNSTPEAPPIKVGAVPSQRDDSCLVSHLAAYHVNLGNVELLSGRHDEALVYCEAAATMAAQARDEEAGSEAAACLMRVRDAIRLAASPQQAAAAVVVVEGGLASSPLEASLPA